MFLPIALLLLASPAAEDSLMNPAAMAQGILQEADQARQAISARDREGALAHVEGAMNLSAGIQQTSAARPLVVPVYTERETTTTYGPVKREKSGVMTASRMKRDTSIRDVEAEITEVSLDVTATEKHLENARLALENSDLTKADNELQAVQQGVMRKTRAADNLPLLRAKENLDLAKARILEDKPKDAKAPLRAAVQSLADYERLSSGPQVQESGHIREEMDYYAARIGGDRDGALARIALWSEKVNSWLSAATH